MNSAVAPTARFRKCVWILLALAVFSANEKSEANILRSADGKCEFDFPGWKPMSIEDETAIKAERGHAILSIHPVGQAKSEEAFRTAAREGLAEINNLSGRSKNKRKLQTTVASDGTPIYYWNGSDGATTHASGFFNRGNSAYFFNVLEYAPTELLLDILPRFGAARTRRFPLSFAKLSERFRIDGYKDDGRRFFVIIPGAAVGIQIIYHNDGVESFRAFAENIKPNSGDLKVLSTLNAGNIALLSGTDTPSRAQREKISRACARPLKDSLWKISPSTWCKVGAIHINFTMAEEGLVMTYIPEP